MESSNKIIYTPNVEDKIEIHVSVKGKEIPKSPFSVQVESKKISIDTEKPTAEAKHSKVHGNACMLICGNNYKELV